MLHFMKSGFVICSYSDVSIVSRLTFILSMPASLSCFACCASSTAFVVSDTLDTGYLLICETISSICGCRSGSPPVRRKCVIPSLVAARTMQNTFYAKCIYCDTFIIVLWVAIITVQITAIYHRYAHVVNLSAKSIAHIKSPSRNRS